MSQGQFIGKIFGMVCFVSVIGISQANAKTDVSGKVEQLKENSEASKANLDQYEDGLKTVNANLIEADKALKALQKQQGAIDKQIGDASKGKVGVDQAKRQLQGYLAEEQQKQAKENQQIEELKKTLAKLEESAQKRQENIAHYQDKIQKVDTELASWSGKNKETLDLQNAIKEKEAQVRAEQKRLADKKTTYELETSKWRKQVRVSDREYQSYSKLKD